MSIKTIVEKALENDPMGMQAAFEEEIHGRVLKALDEKYKKMTKEGDESEDECSHCEGVGYHESKDGEQVDCAKCDGSGKAQAMEAYKDDEEDDDDDDDDDDDEDEVDESSCGSSSKKK